MSKRLKNSKMKYFDNCEHEIFIEKDNHREKFWNEFDSFTQK